MAPLPRVLFVDAYDSFANSVVGLLESQLSVQVTLVHIDSPELAENLEAVLKSFDAVVVGPGPGHPAIPEDVGIIPRLWALSDADLIPVFGVCLGFQSLSLAFGGEVKRMKSPRHGIVSQVVHSGADIFDGIGEFEATQYHSLHVDTRHYAAGGECDTGNQWLPSSRCPELQPLAWHTSDDVNGPILMSVRHTTKPFWGVQFHPESICTTSGGHKMIQKWWEQARLWSTRHGRAPLPHAIAPLSTSSPLPVRANEEIKSAYPLSDLDAALQDHWLDSSGCLSWIRRPLGEATIVEVCEAMSLTEDEVIVLDSQGHASGRYSIIGLFNRRRNLTLRYMVQGKRLLLSAHGQQKSDLKMESIDQIWPLMQSILDRYAPVGAGLPHSSPFWGGWMGYISYEAGLETLDVACPNSPQRHNPDLNFAFIESSIVFDHQEKQIYLQTLSTQDHAWLAKSGDLIDALTEKAGCAASLHCNSVLSQDDGHFEEAMRRSHIDKPVEDEYCQKVLDCQSSLSAGDSYELCLTDETKICIPRTKDFSLAPWTIYKKLRVNNPAPFGCYLRLAGSTVVGSSPERFLSWTREGRCQFRPIKGTVKKAPGVDFAAAHAILNTSKERAENLMIVDLIRHDLSGVVGAANCSVPKLMQVEEYKTVYQLVSVIEGQIPDNTPRKAAGPHSTGAGTDANSDPSPRGIDVLKASLPPGSMTGAPKKRSCEILTRLEQRPRGIYSGVIGYMDVGGGGDFSVVIRTAMKWDSELVMKPAKGAAPGDQAELVPHEVWHVGAGGAVTIQSTALGEFNEMETKLDSVLKTFQV